MAAWFMLTMERLRALHAGACDDDMRVVMRRDEPLNLAIRTRVYRDALREPGYELQHLTVRSARELRLLARQLEWFANEAERPCEPFEEYDS